MSELEIELPYPSNSNNATPVPQQQSLAIPAYLRVLVAAHVMLCTTHGSCYIYPQLGCHLWEQHQLHNIKD
jgi:hypothetical protein